MRWTYCCFGQQPGYDTARDIVELRGLTKSHICQSVDGLTRRGWLSGVQDGQDRRRVHLSLLPAAQTAVAAAQAVQRDFFVRLYRGVSQEERRPWSGSRKNAFQSQGGPAMTICVTSILVCIVAGLGAGIGTGLAGLSAAAVISPMLITFLDFPAYQAVGIALASDVLASAVSAYTYGKNKNLDIKNGLIMLCTVLIFTLIGSWVASLVPNTAMGNFSVFMTFLLGVKFIVRPS
jgi:DNA-binding MarR family transcriptional regulator